MKEVGPTRLHRLFYPVVPVIVMAGEGEGLAMATISSAMPVAQKPPYVALALLKGSRTLSAILRHKGFSLNWLDFTHVRALDVAGFTIAKGVEKLARMTLTCQFWKGIPYLEQAAALVLAKLQSSHRIGDHVLVIGRAIRAKAHEAFGDYWDYAHYKPALYLGSVGNLGRYATIA